MITVKLCKDLYEDVILHSPEFTSYEEGEWEELMYSPECVSFIDKAIHHSPFKSRGRAHWYEVEATPEELSAVIDEVVAVWIDDYEERADEYGVDPEERKELRAMIRKYRKFIQQYQNERVTNEN